MTLTRSRGVEMVNDFNVQMSKMKIPVLLIFQTETYNANKIFQIA